MKLSYYELRALPGIFWEPAFSEWTFIKMLPKGKLMLCFSPSETDDWQDENELLALYINGGSIFDTAPVWVAVDVPNRERLLQELQEDVVDTILRYCLAEPGSTEHDHLNAMCEIERICRLA